VFLHEMSEEQRLELSAVEERFRQNGWNLDTVSELLHSGTWASPEVSADLERDGVELGCDLYFDDRYGVITLETSARRRQFQVYCTASLLPLVDWLTTYQRQLSPTDFARQLHALISTCDRVFYLTAEKRYLLEVNSSFDDFT